VIRHLLWDLDGTLIDSYPAIAGAYQEAAAELGYRMITDEVYALAKVSLTTCITELARCAGADKARMSEACQKAYAAVDPAVQPVMPFAREVLAAVCARGGCNVIVTHRERASTTALLAAHRLTGYFSGIIAGDDGYPRKHDPAAYLAALARYQLDPCETMAVGDRAVDVLGARAAGLVSFLYGRDPLGAAPEYLADDYAELLALIAL